MIWLRIATTDCYSLSIGSRPPLGAFLLKAIDIEFVFGILILVSFNLGVLSEKYT
jgi:hypothetical protein